MHRLNKLPFNNPVQNLETYQALTEANFSLGELQGIIQLVPNLDIILKIISIDEAKSSSEIENISSTHEDYYRDNITRLKSVMVSQDLTRCMRGMKIGYFDLKRQKKINISLVNSIQSIIEPNHTGIRTLPGLKIYNKLNSRVIHVPPQNPNAINEYLANLLEYINNDLDNYDSLIKMALVHYQFECIHPYIDGNGRVGRIINTLYLIQEKKISYPMLNLSKYLCDTQNKYFSLLKKCHNDISYIEEFVLYILQGITKTSKYTIKNILKVNNIIQITDLKLQKDLPNIYSENLVLHLFNFMYTKNELLRTDLNISRATATKYLKLLEDHKFIKSEKVGKEVLYKNNALNKIYDN